MRLVLSRAAAADLHRFRDFLSDKDPRAARDAVATLRAAIDSLTYFPARGRPSGLPGVHELIVPSGRSAYVVRYFHSRRHDAVVVLRIWHGREVRD